jgi:hypothetical protein
MALSQIPLTKLPLILATLLVAACGGGSSTTPFTVQSFEQAFESSVGDSVIDYTFTLVVPNTLEGQASFEGTLLLPTDVQADEGLVGRIQLNANFDQGSLTGSADQFGLYDINLVRVPTFSDGFSKKEDLEGTLIVTDGFTGTVTVGDISAHTIHGDLDGELTGSKGAYTVDAFFAGVLSNSTTSDALVSNGELIGTVVTPDRSIAYGRESGIGGAFIVYSD